MKTLDLLKFQHCFIYCLILVVLYGNCYLWSIFGSSVRYLYLADENRLHQNVKNITFNTYAHIVACDLNECIVYVYIYIYIYIVFRFEITNVFKQPRLE
jgi:hypothetical protein